jgi:drug/metabolite transporter (DMT)-like permease
MSVWPYLVLVLAGLCWGVGLPFGKMALAATDAEHMIALRFLVAAIASAPVVLWRRESRALLRHPAVAAAGLFYAAGFLVQFEGLARSDVTVCALLVGAMPALIAVSAAVTGERVGPWAWSGVAAATLGAMFIAGRPGHASLAGVLLCLGSLPIFLGWLFASRRIPAGPGAAAGSCATIILAAGMLLAVVSLIHGPPRLALGWSAWIGLLGQGLLSTVVATVCWQIGAPRVPAAAAGVFINIEPLVGSGIGMAAFGERPTWGAALGGLLILGGSLAVVLGEHRSTGGVKAAEDAPTPA